MREVTRIHKEETKEEKPVELTHYLDTDSGWKRTSVKVSSNSSPALSPAIESTLHTFTPLFSE